MDVNSQFWTTICTNGAPYAIKLLSVLSVPQVSALEYCGQIAGWIQMPLGT